MEFWMTALVIAMPTVVPIIELRYELDVATARSSGAMPAAKAMNATDSTSPLPRPLRALSA
jgi:hypothetical protein